MCTEKMRLSSSGCQGKTNFAGQLRLSSLSWCTSCTVLVLNTCDCQVNSAKEHYAHDACTDKLQLSRRNCQSVLCVLVSWSFQTFLRAQHCAGKLRRSIRSQSVLRVSLYRDCAENLAFELLGCTWCTTLALKSHNFVAGAAEVCLVCSVY